MRWLQKQSLRRKKQEKWNRKLYINRFSQLLSALANGSPRATMEEEEEERDRDRETQRETETELELENFILQGL